MYITADNSKLIADLCIPIKLHYISLYNKKNRVHAHAPTSSRPHHRSRHGIIIVHVSASRTHQRSRLSVTTASSSDSLFSIRHLLPYTHRISRFMFYCNELPAVRRVDGVCVCAKEDETRFDGTRSFDMYFERSLSLVVEVTVREEE